MCIPVLKFFESLKDFLSKNISLDVQKSRSPIPLHTFTQEIRFENVSFSYPGGREGLRNISFTIKPNETVAIVGKNGAGKSTLIKLLMRLYDPTEGTIYIDGHDLRHIEISSWRKQLSACFQDFGKYHLSIRENIGLGEPSHINSPQHIQAAAEKGGAHIFNRLSEKFETLLGKEFGGTSLSGGEWQKLAMSRAFMKEAQILIFDEPTASLDPQSEHEIFQRFQAQAEGKTTILITHRLGSISMAHRILVMKEGSIVEQGTHRDLLHNNGEYASMYHIQASRYL